MPNDDELHNEIFGTSRHAKGGHKLNLTGLGGGNALPAGLGEMVSIMLNLPSVPKPPAAISDDMVTRHDGSQIVLPEGMTLFDAHRVICQLAEEDEKVTTFNRTFRYRPDDGAYATYSVLKELYGMTVGEEMNMGPFDPPRKPETRTVVIGFNEKVQIPWGRNSVPAIAKDFFVTIGAARDRETGLIFSLDFEAPKKYRNHVERIFEAVEQQLKDHSIYRGKAIVGTETPEFMDLSGFDPSQIVFAEDVTATLEGTIWSAIRYSQTYRDEGIPLKRSALLWGPYGTGKSSAGLLTALEAVRNGWTFISAKNAGDIEEVLETARLYAPAVVFIEDIDVHASTGEEGEVSALLEAFDGITAKGAELISLMTTNHIDKIHKGMLRPGRLDTVVEVTSLDRSGIEKLIKAVVPASKLASNVNYDEVFAAMPGFYPAFVKAAVHRAKQYAISRLKGEVSYVLTTGDLVGAAMSLHSQLQLQDDATEGTKRPALDTVIGEVIKRSAQEAVHGSVLMGHSITVPSLNGHSSH